MIREGINRLRDEIRVSCLATNCWIDYKLGEAGENMP